MSFASNALLNKVSFQNGNLPRFVKPELNDETAIEASARPNWQQRAIDASVLVKTSLSQFIQNGLCVAGLMLTIVTGFVFASGPSPLQFDATDSTLVKTVPASVTLDGWQILRTPMPIYNLESTELAPLKYDYQVAIRGDGARRDSMIWGTFDALAPLKAAKKSESSDPFLHLILERAGEGAVGTSSGRERFNIEITRRATFQGLSLVKSGQPNVMQTKFGPIEIADATLARNDVTRACLVFRHHSRNPEFNLVGWQCGTAEKPSMRAQFTCLIDRIDLLSSGQDKALRRFFAESERNRTPCENPRLALRKQAMPESVVPTAAKNLALRR